jgi:anti-sigma-K factor RskA
MNYSRPELLDQLAAAYAAGSLRGRARARFERLCRDDASAGRARRGWEERLLPLALMLDPVAPSSLVWSSIRMRIDSSSTGPAVKAPRQRWRWLAAAAVVLLALLVGRLTLRSTQWQPVATLAQANAAPMWQVQRSADSGELRLRTLGPATAPAGSSYELWVIPAAGGNPVSLGLLPAQGDLIRVLSAVQRDLVRTAMNIAVSVEPAGGSPTGTPTGPVIIVAPVSAPA